jgi:hypothetical protein
MFPSAMIDRSSGPSLGAVKRDTKNESPETGIWRTLYTAVEKLALSRIPGVDSS